MMRGVRRTMEKHHKVQILDEALEAAVKLSPPLHPGAPAARQGGEPARHRLRARGRQPARDAGRSGRQPQAHRGAGDRARHHRPRRGDRHRHRQARGRGRRAAGSRARAPRRPRRRAGTTRRRWSTSCWPCAPSCATASSRSKAPAASSRPMPRRWRHRRRADGRSRGRARRQAGAAEAGAGQADGAAGRDAADPADGRRPGRGRGGRRLDRHPGRPHGHERDRDRSCKLADTLGAARHRPGPRAGHDRQAHPDLARRARQPEQADRRVHAGRHLGRRQDRDRAGAGRGALRRRAEPDHHQHERVPGGAHGLAR